MGHSNVFSVRDLFQSDTVTCFVSEILDLHDSESGTVTCFVSEILDLHDSESETVTCFVSEILDLHDSESETVTCFLSEIYSNRTQWRVLCPRIWIYMTQNRTQWLVICPRIWTSESCHHKVRDYSHAWRKFYQRLFPCNKNRGQQIVTFFLNLPAKYFCRSRKPCPCCVCPWPRVRKPELNE
jgi:hypothetical protein